LRLCFSSGNYFPSVYRLKVIISRKGAKPQSKTKVSRDLDYRVLNSLFLKFDNNILLCAFAALREMYFEYPQEVRQ
jgi:hypothetical protein